VWEEANGRGYVACHRSDEGVTSVSVSAAGRAELDRQRRIVWPDDAPPATTTGPAPWKGHA
jgi:hypothetical protein